MIHKSPNNIILKAIAFTTLQDLRTFALLSQLKGLGAEASYSQRVSPTFTLRGTFRVLPETPCVFYFYVGGFTWNNNTPLTEWLDALVIEALTNFPAVSLTISKIGTLACDNHNIILHEANKINSSLLEPLKRRLIDTHKVEQNADIPAKLKRVYSKGVFLRDILETHSGEIK